MSESINSVSSEFRDFLLNRNLVSDTVTQNGLQSLLTGIGVPITNVGTPTETVMPSTSIEDNGDFYKDLNLVNNRFQGTDDDYRRVSMVNLPSNKVAKSTTFAYSPYYTANHGILDDTLNTPATGPFQGGDIRQFNTSFNLYDDPDKRLLVDLTDVGRPNVKYTNYLDLNSGIDQIGLNLLGSILGGQGIGIGGGANGSKLVPSFDLRATLVGRVLGGTGVISDTPLGQAGAKYLALAFANNAAFGLQQETIGHLNLNPLSIAMNGLGSIVVPNYDITVPKSTLGRVLNFGAKVLGFESPISLYTRASSIFASENPVSNIERAQSQILNSGKGQVLSLFSNLKVNTYRPKYEDKRVKSASNRAIDTGTNGKLYAFDTGDGTVQDLLNVTAQPALDSGSDIVPDEDNYTNAPEDGGTIGFESNHGKITSELDGIATGVGSGFEEDTFTNISVSDDSLGYPFAEKNVNQYIWGDTRNNKPGQRAFDGKDRFTSEKSILTKTQSLFKTNKMRTLTSGKAVISEVKSDIQSGIQSGFMSKGSGVLSDLAIRTIDGGGNVGTLDADNVFCRTWTTFDRYSQVVNLQKNSGINGDTAYRDNFEDSVLDSNGFVRIAPFVGDEKLNAAGESNIKNFMFSIENLAWADGAAQAKLLPCEKGPGDLTTGKSGRIMWFPPYDITINENTAVNWEGSNFIGRGEPVYTYNNTERTGTLQFKIVVDHPSYLNALKDESDEYIASYFAGCTDIDPELAKKLTTEEKSAIIQRNKEIIPPPKKEVSQPSPSLDALSFYFPNDVSTLDLEYEDKFEAEGGGLGTTKDEKIVSENQSTSIDQTDFGLNGDKNPELGQEGGWRTFGGRDVIRYVLNQECQSCKIYIKGFASTQGGASNPANDKISKLRGENVKQWLIDNVLSSGDQTIYADDKLGSYEARFGEIKAEGSVGCPRGSGTRQDEKCLKEARKVEVEIKMDTDLHNKLTKEDVIKVEPQFEVEDVLVNQEIINRFYNECNYFEKLKEEDPIVYSSMKEKIKFFHPAFHAITPEGLNSRLTFLHQCTRQGPTILDGRPDNLAFGRPPICILRLGDFYHTKIAIDNLSISYEPLVWDLNPDGIGVQPMIATCDLSFKIIGGQSLKGPINKLQNAVSFNFFGNTGVYDVRADRIAKKPKITEKKAALKKVLGDANYEAFGVGDIPDYTIVEGEQVMTPIVINTPEESQNPANVPEPDQIAQAEENTGEVAPSSGATSSDTGTTATTINNVEVGKAIGIKEFAYDEDGGSIYLTCFYQPKHEGPKLVLNESGDSIKCQLNIRDGQSQIDVGSFKVTYNSDKSVSINPSNKGVYDDTAIEFIVEFNSFDEDAVKIAIDNGSSLKLVNSTAGKAAGGGNASFSNTNNKI